MGREERVTFDPNVMAGKPVIRGTRVTVEILLEKLEAGLSTEEVLVDYPFLEREDVLAAIAYARRALGTEELIPLAARAS